MGSRQRFESGWHVRDLGFVAAAAALLTALAMTRRLWSHAYSLQTKAHDFLTSWSMDFVALMAAMTLVLLGHKILGPRGAVRWIGIFALAVAGGTLGWYLQGHLRGLLVPEATPLHGYVAIAAWHRVTIMAVAIAGMQEFLRQSRHAEAALHAGTMQRVVLDRELASAQLQVLQAQIEPHFLFNSLANLRRLMRIDAAAGPQMLADLLRYFEAALPSMRDDKSTLGREATLVRAFLSVHQIRMGQRLLVEYHLPAELHALALPPMMLLTLVENALKHGLHPLPEGGLIRIDAHAADGRLVIRVADTGRGLAATSGGMNSGSGTGLANIRARLTALYGSAAALSLRLNEPRGFVAEISLPSAA